MPKAIKWAAILLALFAVVLILAIIIAPMVISIEKYKPQIEAEASKAINRPVTLAGEISPSIFPWVGIALGDVHIGNPPGFKEKDFVSVGLFEVRIKLLPLLTSGFKNIEIKRFVVKDPEIVLEKSKSGKSNLEGLAKGSAPAGQPAPPAVTKTQEASAPAGLPITSFQANEFAITNARLLIIDQAAGSRHDIKDLNLVLTHFSLDKVIGLKLSALADGKPVSVTGQLGPVGPDPGKSPVALDLVAELLQQLKIEIKGRVEHPIETPAFDIRIQIPTFSARKVLAAMDQPLPMTPADPNALNNISLAMQVAGTPEKVSISNGQLLLDDTKMTFQAQAGQFDKPDIKLEAEMDQIDVDRYLPAPAEKTQTTAATASPLPSPAEPEPKKKTDYTPLRKLILDARIKVGAMKAKNLHMQNILVKATAKDGVIRLNPFNVDLYQGKIATTGTFDVRRDQPRSNFNLSVNKVEAGPLLKDFLNKELIEGAVAAAMDLQFEGDQPDLIRKTLDGKGEIKFTDGAIVGIDLANMVRNVQAAFGLAEKTNKKPRTDFSEFIAPFSIKQGVFNLANAQLTSPLLRLNANGNADLVSETIDMRIEPKFVATLVGQGDTQQRSGLAVPVLVSGTFSKPKFTPDLKAILNQQLPDKEALQKLIPKKEELEKIVPPKENLEKELEKKAQELFKGLPFGKQKE